MKLDEELKSYLVAPVDTPSLKINENEEDVDMSLVAKQDENKVVKEVSFDVETDLAYADVVDNKITLNNMIYIIDK